MCPYNPFLVRHGILQIQILKPLIAESGVVLPQKLGFHKGTLVLERGNTGIDFPLCLHNQRLMYLFVPTLDNQEIRGIHPDVTPAIPGGFVALDLELRHSPVAVVVDLQPGLFHLP